MRKKQVCPCLNKCTAPTCSCVFVRVVLSKKKIKKNWAIVIPEAIFLRSFGESYFSVLWG